MNEPITYERLQEALEKACDKLEDLNYDTDLNKEYFTYIQNG